MDATMVAQHRQPLAIPDPDEVVLDPMRARLRLLYTTPEHVDAWLAAHRERLDQAESVIDAGPPTASGGLRPYIEAMTLTAFARHLNERRDELGCAEGPPIPGAVAEPVGPPAERWEVMSAATSLQKLAEAKGKKGKPPTVRSVVHEGRRYVILGGGYGPWGPYNKSVLDAYELVPEALYEGPTTDTYHDEAAILAGRRARGDHTGLRVTVNRETAVLGTALRFIKEPPTTAPLPMSEARTFDDECRASGGWRRLMGDELPREWGEFNGHPAVRYYPDPQSQMAFRGLVVVLYAKSDGRIGEFTMDREVPIAPVSEPAPHTGDADADPLGLEPRATKAQTELSLF